MILVIIQYMIFASAFTMGKFIMQYIQPMLYAGVRLTLSGSILLTYLYFFNRTKLKVYKSDFADFVKIVVIFFYLSFITGEFSLSRLTSVNAALLYNLSPFVMAFFSYFYFAEKMTGKKLLGMIIGFCAFLPTFIYNGSSQESVVAFFSWGELAMIFSVVTFSYGWIVVRRLVRKGYSPFIINGIGMLGGGLLSFMSSLIVDGTPQIASLSGDSFTDLLKVCGAIAFVMLTTDFIYFNLNSFLLRTYTATFLSFAGFLIPVFAALYGWLFFGETIGWPFFITATFVTLGLYLFFQEELRQGYVVRR